MSFRRNVEKFGWGGGRKTPPMWNRVNEHWKMNFWRKSFIVFRAIKIKKPIPERNDLRYTSEIFLGYPCYFFNCFRGCLQNVAYTIWPTIWLTFGSLLAYLWPTVGLLLAHYWPTCGPLLAYRACIWCTYSLPYLFLFSFAYQIFVFCCTHMVNCFQASILISLLMVDLTSFGGCEFRPKQLPRSSTVH